MTTPRQRARERTEADILRIGREHLTRHGPTGLSLRAVARDLGVVSSAVYRYVASRDDLLTLLIVDAYDELGTAVDAAVGAVPDSEPAAQFHAAGHAVRTWALAEPARYALLFGTPVSGYRAPGERTSGPGTRVIFALIGIWQRAFEQGLLVITEGAETDPLPPALAADVQVIRSQIGVTLPDLALARGLLAWPALFGAVNWEVFGQWGEGTFRDPVALFDHQLESLSALMGLRAS